MSFIFQKVGRGTAEIFKILKNGESSAIGQGNAVCYDFTTAKDGKTVILPTTTSFGLFAGVVANGVTLAKSGSDGEWGKVQIYGLHGGVKVGGGVTASLGDALVPVNSSGVMTVGNSTNIDVQFVRAAANATTTIYKGLTCFIRAM